MEITELHEDVLINIAGPSVELFAPFHYIPFKYLVRQVS